MRPDKPLHRGKVPAIVKARSSMNSSPSSFYWDTFVDIDLVCSVYAVDLTSIYLYLLSMYTRIDSDILNVCPALNREQKKENK